MSTTNLYYKCNDEVVANFQLNSTNSKTGKGVQVYFLPIAAIEKGKYDFKTMENSVCFDCIHSQRKDGDCYVIKGNAARGLYSKIRALSKKWPVQYATEQEIIEACRDRYVRFGAYGEPVLLPITLVRDICKVTNRWTGYTHQWKKPKYKAYSKYFMASVDSAIELVTAQAFGWRSYVVVNKESTLESFMTDNLQLKYKDSILAINCPASKEAGRKVTCNNCLLCRGTSVQAKDIFIKNH